MGSGRCSGHHTALQVLAIEQFSIVRTRVLNVYNVYTKKFVKKGQNSYQYGTFQKGLQNLLLNTYVYYKFSTQMWQIYPHCLTLFGICH